MKSANLNEEVTRFLDALNHPMHREIDLLRRIIMSTGIPFTEGIKWNGPNYSIDNQDRITMRVHPLKKIQLIFHRGAKVKQQPTKRLLDDNHSVLEWKENDRAIATFNSKSEIEQNEIQLKEIISQWIDVTLT